MLVDTARVVLPKTAPEPCELDQPPWKFENPKPGARWRSGAKDKRDRVRSSYNFDQTKGYEGEGPPPGRLADGKSRVCFQCRKSGHMARECKSICARCGELPCICSKCKKCGKKGHATQRCRAAIARVSENIVASLVGLPAEQAADIAEAAGDVYLDIKHPDPRNLSEEDTREGDNLTDMVPSTGPPSGVFESKERGVMPTSGGGGGPPPPPPPPAVALGFGQWPHDFYYRDGKDEERRAIYDKLFASAKADWMVRSFTSPVDQHIVQNKLFTMQNGAKLYLLVDDPIRVCSFIYVRGMEAARDQRYWQGRRVASSMGGMLAALWALLTFHVVPALAPKLHRDPVKTVAVLESYRPWSAIFLVWWQLLLWMLLAFMRVVLFAVCEEYIKYLSFVLLMEVEGLWAGVGLGVLMTLSISVVETRLAPRKFRFLDRLMLHGLFVAFSVLFHVYHPTWKWWAVGVLPHATWNMVVLVLVGDADYLMDIFHTLYGDGEDTLTDICLEHLNTKPITVGEDFRLLRLGDSCRAKFGSRRLFGVDGYCAMVYRSCTHNERISLEGRVGKQLFYEVPDCKRDHADVGIRPQREWRKLQRRVIPVFQRLIPRVFAPMPYEAWCRTFPPAKRDYFLKFLKEVLQPRFRISAAIAKDRFGRLRKGIVETVSSVAKCFIKRELAVYPVEEFSDLVFKDPRWISGCPPELTAYLGPWVRQLAKNVHSSLKPREEGAGYTLADILVGRQIVYTCGMTCESIGEAFARAMHTVGKAMDPDDEILIVEDDQSRFDLHLKEGPFTFLNQCYDHFLGRKKGSALRRTKDPCRGVSCNGTSYEVAWTMRSGWPDTSVGDTLVNAAMKYGAHGIGELWLSIICGDDSITVTTRKALSRAGGVAGLHRAYRLYGMDVEIFIRDHPLDAEFCSSVFMPCGKLADGVDNYVLFPKPGKVFARMGWDMVNRPPAVRKQWLRAIAETIATYGHYDPILSAFAQNLLGKTRGVVALDLPRNEFQRQYSLTRDSEEMDFFRFYAHRYGFSEAHCLALRTYLCGCPLGALSNALLDAVVERDVL
jgi:hypothetical protein